MEKYFLATFGDKEFTADTLPELADKIAAYHCKIEFTCPIVTELQVCDYAGERVLYASESLGDLLLDAWDKHFGPISAKVTKEIWAKERA
jgi:hypothetical protein